MKAGKWLLAVAALLFVGYVLYGTMGGNAVRCEVCLEFDGEMVCRAGAGETREEAVRAAQESACGGNARGMSESIACRNRTPDRVQCSTG